jgi:hypothetical protein
MLHSWLHRWCSSECTEDVVIGTDRMHHRFLEHCLERPLEITIGSTWAALQWNVLASCARHGTPVAGILLQNFDCISDRGRSMGLIGCS